MSKFINTVGGRRGRIDPDITIPGGRRHDSNSEYFGKFVEDNNGEVGEISLKKLGKFYK